MRIPNLPENSLQYYFNKDIGLTVCSVEFYTLLDYTNKILSKLNTNRICMSAYDCWCDRGERQLTAKTRLSHGDLYSEETGKRNARIKLQNKIFKHIQYYIGTVVDKTCHDLHNLSNLNCELTDRRMNNKEVLLNMRMEDVCSECQYLYLKEVYCIGCGINNKFKHFVPMNNYQNEE